MKLFDLENDLVPLDYKSQSTTPMPAPIIPEIAIHPTVTYTTPLAQHRLILANRLAQAVQGFSLSNDLPTTPLPKDPFLDDPSSGQHPKTNGNVSPMLLNERLMARQFQLASNFNNGRQFNQMATVNELPMDSRQGVQMLKPIVPEVVVRGVCPK